MLTVSKTIKEYINEQNMRMSKDVVEAVESHVEIILARAVSRAVSNGRSTVMGQDV